MSYMLNAALYGGAKYGIPDFIDPEPAFNKGYLVINEFTKQAIMDGYVERNNCTHFMDNWYSSTLLSRICSKIQYQFFFLSNS